MMLAHCGHLMGIWCFVYFDLLSPLVSKRLHFNNFSHLVSFIVRVCQMASLECSLLLVQHIVHCSGILSDFIFSEIPQDSILSDI